MDYSPIVQVRNLELTHADGTQALRNINLVIPRGGITALLGPSASGKTSLLSAIVGLRQPAHAVIERNYDSLGFMPQDLCLHEYFTVEEILMFYGRLHGVVHLPSVIQELLHTFEIPGSRSISNLSGGTKRRVSLCCAIIHRPQFIILDEPTVGVDPLLRRKMWECFRELVRSGSTLLVSTHYTEEAALASSYVFLRRGRILDVGNVIDPKDLNEKYYDHCLEDQGNPIGNDDQHLSKFKAIKRTLSPSLQRSSSCHQNPIKFMDALWIMSYKNMVVLKRHKFFMGFQAILPLVTLFIFICSIGRPLRDITLSVFNEESGDCGERIPFTCPSMDSLLTQNMDFMANSSCQILYHISQGGLLRVNHYAESLAEAKNMMLKGHSHAAIHFPKDFSRSLARNKLLSTDSSKIFIGVYLDTSNKLISDAVSTGIYYTLEDTLQTFLKVCSIPIKPSDLLLKLDFLNEFSAQMELTMGMLPIMMNAVLYFMALALTADLTASEKEAGLLARLVLAGVSFRVCLVSQILVQSIVASAQVLLCLGFLRSVLPFSLPLLFLIMFLFALQSLSGMVVGVFLSTICSSREQVIQYGLAIIFPTFLLCGVLWPLSSLPDILRAVSYSLPVTIPGQFIQRVVFRQTVDSLGSLLVSIVIPITWIAGLGLLIHFCASRSGSLYIL